MQDALFWAPIGEGAFRAPWTGWQTDVLAELNEGRIDQIPMFPGGNFF